MNPAFGSITREPSGKPCFFGDAAKNVSITLAIEDTGKGIGCEVNFNLDVSHFIFSAVGLDVGLELGHVCGSNHYSRTLSLESKLNNRLTLAHLWQGL